MVNRCEEHRAYVFDRGGMRRILELTPMTSITWGRIRDDISTATIHLAAAECAAAWSDVEPGRHELVVYWGDKRVWEGPITLITFHRDDVEVQAKDVMYYPYRTALHKRYKSDNQKVIDRAYRVLRDELNRVKETLDPPVNVVPYIERIAGANDARTWRVTVPFEKSVFDEVDSLAEDAGMDYTVVGRSILLFDTHTAPGRTQQVGDSDLLGDVRLTLYGSQLATHAVVTGADGDYGYAGEVDDYYGEWEIVVDAFNEDDEDATPPDPQELRTQAASELVGRLPTPLEVRLPANAQLSPTSAITVDELVPGTQIPLRAVFAGRRFARMQKLNEMRVTEDGNGVKTQVTLVPANNELPDDPGL
jgi:hypothetical protein